MSRHILQSNPSKLLTWFSKQWLELPTIGQNYFRRFLSNTCLRDDADFLPNMCLKQGTFQKNYLQVTIILHTFSSKTKTPITKASSAKNLTLHFEGLNDSQSIKFIKQSRTEIGFQYGPTLQTLSFAESNKLPKWEKAIWWGSSAK